jgi:hypothetical protein
LENADSRCLAGDLERVVGREGVDEQHLVGKGDALEALPDVHLFIE